MNSILVTGGAGFIGTNFVRYWNEKHPEDRLVVLDALTYSGNVANIADLLGARCKFVQGSIVDTSLVIDLLNEYQVTTVVHFAAESHVDRSISGPDKFIQTNVVGTHNLLSACREVWLGNSIDNHRFHHVSTDEVYGTLGKNDPAFSEQTAYSPSSPYSASKAAADHLVQAYHRTYGLSTTISNCSNNYGPFHFPEKLIPLCLVNLLTGQPLPVYGTGLNIRDWLHVDDHCAAIDAIISRGEPGETYNIGANCEKSNIEVVETLCSAVDEMFCDTPILRSRFSKALPARGEPSRNSIEFIQDRPGHDFRYAIDSRKITTMLGFSSKVKFETGIRATLHWYIDNEEWWRAAIKDSKLSG